MANGKSGNMPGGDPRKRSVSHPRYSLSQAERLAKAAFEMGGRNCDHDRVARALEYKNATNGAYLGLKATALQFGLIDSSGSHLSVKPAWMQAFKENDPAVFARVRTEAMQQPQLYKLLIGSYRDRQLPSPDRLERELYTEEKYGILRDAANTAAQVFLDSANYASIIDANNFLRLPSVNDVRELVEADDITQPSILDTYPTRGLMDRSESMAHPASRSYGASATANPMNIPMSDELDRIDIRLVNGKKIYLFVPLPLPRGEKERIKKMIDLLVEDTVD